MGEYPKLVFDHEHKMWAVEIKFPNREPHRMYFDHREEALERFLSFLED